MKYAMVIAIGASDEPHDDLDGKTPLAAASLANLNTLAQAGRVGWSGIACESNAPTVAVALASALGYDPERTGDMGSALLAAACIHQLERKHWAMNLDWVSTTDAQGQPSTDPGATMSTQGPVNLTPDESRVLLAVVKAAWQAGEPDFMANAEVLNTSGGIILIDRSGRSYAGLETVSPTVAMGEAWDRVLPGRGGLGVAALMRRLLALGQAAIQRHDITRVRHDQGLAVVTMPWLSGLATRPDLKALDKRFHLRGAIVSVDPLAIGLAHHAGWVHCGPAALGPGEAEAQVLGMAAVDALAEHDIVCCVLRSPMEASLRDDPAAKVVALEAIDQHVVGPIAARLHDFGDPTSDPGARGWRFLFTPGCGWPLGDVGPTDEAAPVVLAGAWIRSMVQRPCTEEAAADADLRIESGHDLLEYFLLGGLVKATVALRKPTAGKGQTGELF